MDLWECFAILEEWTPDDPERKVEPPSDEEHRANLAALGWD